MMKKLISLFLLLALLTGCSLSVQTVPPATAPTGGEFTVHAIDVGQADCFLLECGGKFMLIDGGNREDSDLVVTYLEQQGVSELEAVVCTHAHEDHVGGLPAVLAVYPTKAVYAPTNTYSSNIFDKFLYYTDQQGLSVTIPGPGDILELGSATAQVMGPVKSYAETNDTSIVLLVTFGQTRFLFTGDMETAAENDMLDYWEGKVNWNVDVLKVGHHGSSTSSSYRLVYEADPEYGLVSVGTDNSYGHPHREILKLYRDAGVPLLRTDRLGHILLTSDGKEVTVTWENQNAQPDVVENGESTTYIGNKNSKKLHAPDCKNLPKAENQVLFEDFNEALSAGYEPCGSCLG